MAFYPGHKIVTLQDGAKIGYAILGEEHVGKKIPLVLINGMSGRMGDWDRLTDELKKRRPVLIFDNRGIGDSTLSTPEDHLTMEIMANDTIELIKSFGWTDVDICGHSMGGVILQQILITPNLPFNLHHALLTSTTTKWPEMDPEVAQASTAFRSSGAAPTEEEKAEFMRKTIRVNFDEIWLADKANEGAYQRWLEIGAIGRPTNIIQKQGVALFTTDTRPSLPKIAQNNPSTKILLFHGTRDRVIYPSEFHILRDLLPQATNVNIGDKPGEIPSLEYGHLWWEYFAIDVWVNVVEGFLEDDIEGGASKL